MFADLVKTHRLFIREAVRRRVGSAWKAESGTKNWGIFEMMSWHLEQRILDLCINVGKQSVNVEI
jgi:hypothetical protein